MLIVFESPVVFCRGFFFFTALLTVSFPGQLVAEPGDERKKEIMYLLKHDCGSCHGMTLRGGLGPALTSKKLSDRPDTYLVNVILNGIEGTPMPPWKGFLTENETRWLIGQLRSGVLYKYADTAHE